MTTDKAGPLSRPVSVFDLPDQGMDATVEATQEEREALARDFEIPAIHSLSGFFHLSGTSRRVHVSGRIAASVSQICVVTLDPFESEIQENVEVDFAAPDIASAQAGEDAPDAIVEGAIDLGALTAEFLALGLDPYPRKPGVDFTYHAAEDKATSPFAALAKLKRDE